jgi:hypothetical protein
MKLTPPVKVATMAFAMAANVNSAEAMTSAFGLGPRLHFKGVRYSPQATKPSIFPTHSGRALGFGMLFGSFGWTQQSPTQSLRLLATWRLTSVLVLSVP